MTGAHAQKLLLRRKRERERDDGPGLPFVYRKVVAEERLPLEIFYERLHFPKAARARARSQKPKVISSREVKQVRGGVSSGAFPAISAYYGRPLKGYGFICWKGRARNAPESVEVLAFCLSTLSQVSRTHMLSSAQLKLKLNPLFVAQGVNLRSCRIEFLSIVVTRLRRRGEREEDEEAKTAHLRLLMSPVNITLPSPLLSSRGG